MTFLSPDPLLSAFARHKAKLSEPCVDCLPTSRYVGPTADGLMHEFKCTVCGTPTLFDRVVQDSERNAADVLKAGGSVPVVHGAGSIASPEVK